MEDLTDGLMGVIKKSNTYFQSGVANEMWKFVLERQPESGVDGEVTVKHSEPYGVMEDTVVGLFMLEPKLSKYFTFDEPMQRMALRAEYCRETTDFSDAMIQIMCALRSVFNEPYRLLDRYYSGRCFEFTNGVSPEEYILPAVLGVIFGVVTERFAISMYYETDDGEVFIAVPMLDDELEAKHSRSLLRLDPLRAGAWKKFDRKCRKLRGQLNSFETELAESDQSAEWPELDVLEDLATSYAKLDLRCELDMLAMLDELADEAEFTQTTIVSFGSIDGIPIEGSNDSIILKGPSDRPYCGIARILHAKIKPEKVTVVSKYDWLEWMTPEKLRTALLSEEFTLVTGLVMIDALYRHGMRGISMSDEQKKAMEDALHPLKNLTQAFAGVFPNVSMFGKESSS